MRSRVNLVLFLLLFVLPFLVVTAYQLRWFYRHGVKEV